MKPLEIKGIVKKNLLVSPIHPIPGMKAGKRNHMGNGAKKNSMNKRKTLEFQAVLK